MLELYSAATPNGHRVAILLEELGLPYRLHEVALVAGTRTPDFLAINPAGAIPVLRDGDLVIAQSGAIMLYLAEKTGRFMPPPGATRATMHHWLLFALSDVSAISSAHVQMERFVTPRPAEASAYFLDVLYRHFAACEVRLASRDYLADEYGLPDMALYPLWRQRRRWIGERGALPALAAWGERVGARPAVERGMQAPPFRREGKGAAA